MGFTKDSQTMNKVVRRPSTTVICATCRRYWPMRNDGIQRWKGLCASCAQKRHTGWMTGDDIRKKCAERSAKWRGANPDRAREAERRYHARNPKYGTYKASMQRLRHLTPAWADRKKIRKIYEETPPGCSVDHIIPCRHDAVCGLHVPDNLQYLTHEENARKNNAFTPG